jgi:hypothetical protein
VIDLAASFPVPTSRGPWRALAAVAVLNVLAGCGLTGDFGRPRPSVLNGQVPPGIAAVVPGLRSKTLGHELTDEERLLRALADPLIAPPYDLDKFQAFVRDVGLAGPPPTGPDRGAYAAYLFDTPHRSQTARYNKLIEDIRTDVVRIDPFLRVARQVEDLDSKRAKSFAHVPNVSPEERSAMARRIEENKAVVRRVQAALHERAASYQVALERLVIAAPSPNAVEAERSLTLLRQRIASHV